MNQKPRQNSKNNIEKDFHKFMNNSNFGHDCRNNLDNFGSFRYLMKLKKSHI